MIRRLLIRPGAIGDFIVSLPALEALRGDYTEVWCAERNAPLVRFADRVQTIVSAGLDRIGVLPAEDVMARLATFDSIVSWYGTNRPEFRELVCELPFQFLPALPDGRSHAVEYYRRQALELGAREVGRFPEIPCPATLTAAPRTFAAIHPFASSPKKRAPMELFRTMANRLAAEMHVHWLAGPEESLENAVRMDNLYELACWLRGARVFVGNDSGISHLAAAVGTPVLSLFTASDSRVWTPRGSAVSVAQCGFVPAAPPDASESKAEHRAN